MRKGQNLTKQGKAAYQPKKLGIAILSYIPELTGYFANSLEILDLQIASIHAHTNDEFDLYLFDNGSCPEIQTHLLELQNRGYLTGVYLSQVNMGKTGALNFLLASIPNEYICYSDSDFYFRDGWLEESYKLLLGLPNAAIVSVFPALFENITGDSKAKKVAINEGYQFVKAKPELYVIEEYTHGIGLDEEKAEIFINQVYEMVFYPPSGTTGIVGACHAQFFGSCDRLKELLPLPSNYALSTKEDLEFDLRIDGKGWLRVSSLTPYVLHVGNYIDEQISPEIDAFLSNSANVLDVKVMSHKEDFKRSFYWKVLVAMAKNPLTNRILKRFYINLFELYSLR